MLTTNYTFCHIPFFCVNGVTYAIFRIASSENIFYTNDDYNTSSKVVDFMPVMIVIKIIAP